MRTPLGRVLGHGSARSGTQHFWRLRLTAIAILPLSIFVVALLVSLIGKDHAAVADILGRPIIALPLILTIGITAYHMRLGMQDVIDDYVHGTAMRLASTIANIGFALVVAAAAIFALLKLSFGN